ncbi:hypothetical protein ACFVFT_38545 [Streptomyces tendae]|uniref:hypothetical protein n=1 Tax=Streptomyces tendae TaxID=1932 RepID=UPI003689BC56
MKRFRRLTRRPRPASVFAATLAAAILGTLGVIGTSDATPDDFRPEASRTASPVPVTDADIVTAYNDGWTEGREDLTATDCAEPVPTAPADVDPLTAAYNDGWIDGQQDLIDSGACTPQGAHTGAVAAPLECEHANAPADVFRLCLEVAARPGGTDAIAALPQTPGTPAWTDALRALDHKQRNA